MSRINEVTAMAYRTAQTAGTATAPDVTDSFSNVFSSALESAGASETDTSKATGDAITQAVEDSLINAMLSATASSSGQALGTDLSSGGGLESMLLSAAAEGDITETQIALFMMMLMMNSAEEGSDTSMLMGVMSALLSASGDASSANYVDTADDGTSDAAGNTAPAQIVKGWDSSPGVVKNTDYPSVSGTGSAILPTQYWKPATPSAVGSEAARSAEAYNEIIAQFNVDSAARYQPRDGYTYCNIFVWDVTSALGCEIPHYVDAKTGEPMTYPNVSGAMELNSNRTLDWLTTKGAEYGWREVSAEDAQNMANDGFPAVGVWKNDGGIGHIQMVCPSKDGAYDALRGPAVAQAGRKTTSYTYQSNIYSTQGQSKVRYFVHT